MPTLEHLAAHLRTLSPEELSALLTARLDVLQEPAPRSLGELAGRLLRQESIIRTLSLSALPHVQVAEAVAALGDGWTVARLADLLGVSTDDPFLRETLSVLAGRGLVWPGAGSHLRVMWPHPLGLGPTAAQLLQQLDVVALREIAAALGVTPGRTKRAAVAELAAWLGDAEKVRALVAQAPASVGRSLSRIAQQSLDPFGFGMMLGAQMDAPPWALDCGLVVRSPWGSGVQMPAEVALALRGGAVPFTPEPPSPPLGEVDADLVERESAAAAADMLSLVTAVTELIGRTSVTVLKNGGIGIRELRRMAKAAGRDEDRIRFAVEVMAAGGMVGGSERVVALGDGFEEYATMEPPEQLLDLADSWLGLPACPLAPGSADEPALSWDYDEEAVLSGLRAGVIGLLASMTVPGQSLDPAELPGLLAWHMPFLTEAARDDLDRFVTGVWREAHLLGLLAHGAITLLGRHLLAGDAEALRAHLAVLIPPARTTVVLQNDLTAVVTGTPSAALLALLDGMAVPSSRQGAWTWRFTPAGVLRALDAGATAESLITELTAVSEGGRLPQPLEYLIKDVGRQHGRVQVRAVGCVLCSTDESLLDEIVASRALKGLRLVRLAPTVAASAKPPAETLVALREGGYAPTEVRADGSPAVSVVRQRKAAPVPASVPHAPALADPVSLADRLLSRA
ncbi:helicase-associated domain-containing protein [Actinoplanes missouriensis]|uniref:helicase-associated domain-containing protein n=1 Tax=Actinoplanes missouriensis TaxID=1866 RepID=UPI0033DDBC5E